MRRRRRSAVYRDKRWPLAFHALGERLSANSVRSKRKAGSRTDTTSSREGRWGGPYSPVSSRAIHVMRSEPAGRTRRATSRAYLDRSAIGRLWKHPLSRADPNAEFRYGSERQLPWAKTAEDRLLDARRWAAAMAAGARSMPVTRNPWRESHSAFEPAPHPMSKIGPGGRTHPWETASTNHRAGRGEYHGSRVYGTVAYSRGQSTSRLAAARARASASGPAAEVRAMTKATRRESLTPAVHRCPAP